MWHDNVLYKTIWFLKFEKLLRTVQCCLESNGAVSKRGIILPVFSWKVKRDSGLVKISYPKWFLTITKSLREKCSYSELSWSTFSRIRTKYGKILSISPYSVRMRENADQNNSEYGHFLCSDYCCMTYMSVYPLKCFFFFPTCIQSPWSSCY